MSELITVDGLNTVSISSTEEARQARDSLLVATATVVVVNNTEQATVAANVLKDLKALTRSVEASRVAVKAPILEQGKKIDALAKELTNRLELEGNRISQLLGGYQAEQNRIAEEAKRKAWEEEDRIRRYAAKAQAEAEAKAQAEADALALKEARARSESKAAEYAALAKVKEEQAAKAQAQRDYEAEQAIIATRLAAAAQAPVKQAGVSTRKEMRFEVTDITTLYEAAPYLVVLTPNAAAIKQALKGLTGSQKLPGVKHWEEAVTIVR